MWLSIVMVGLLIANLVILLSVAHRLAKQEKFQTGEAHTNFEMINRSLKQLSDIAEKSVGHSILLTSMIEPPWVIRPWGYRSLIFVNPAQMIRTGYGIGKSMTLNMCACHR